MDVPNHKTQSWLTYQLIALGIFSILLTACASGTASANVDNLPAGDVMRGEALFTQPVNGAPPCSTCHKLDGTSGVGPPFNGYSQLAESRITNQTATEYTVYSILQPSKHLVSGYPNVMYARYGDKLSDQDIADLVAYVLSN